MGQMINIEKEREKFHDWTSECEMYNTDDSIAFSLWQINNSLEKLVKATKEKA
jgi:hypothetical protein